MDRANKNTSVPPSHNTQPGTSSAPAKGELDFSGWSAMSVESKRQLVLTTATQDNLHNRLCALEARKVKLFDTKGGGNPTANKEAVNTLWNDLNMVRDEQFALKMQLESLGCKFEESDPLVQILGRMNEELKAISSSIQSSSPDGGGDNEQTEQKKIGFLARLIKKIKFLNCEKMKSEIKKLPASLLEKIKNAGSAIDQSENESLYLKQQKKNREIHLDNNTDGSRESEA